MLSKRTKGLGDEAMLEEEFVAPPNKVTKARPDVTSEILLQQSQVLTAQGKLIQDLQAQMKQICAQLSGNAEPDRSTTMA